MKGFKSQKTSDLNLEHVFSHGQWAAYYYTVADSAPDIAVGREGESAAKAGRRAWQANSGDVVRKPEKHGEALLESLRYQIWPEDAYDRQKAGRIQIRLDSG